MRCRISEIDKFHGLLNAAIGLSVHGATTIDQLPQFRETNAWKERSYRGTIAFSLWSKPMVGQVLAEGWRPVHQLREVGDDNKSGWVSWHDEWTRRRGEEAYQMLESGFVFYWGPRTHLDKIFRAEWSVNGIERAAHPHWHTDCAVIGTEIGISRIHFGMGGWTHAETQCVCWQIRPSSADDVRDWAIRTLEYCREQLQHYPPS